VAFFFHPPLIDFHLTKMIFRRIQVYEDLIAAEGPSRTMIRTSSLVPRSHPQICRISKSTRIWQSHRAYCTFPDCTHY